MENKFEFGAILERDIPGGVEDLFTPEQMEKVPADKLWYRLSGYDEHGYWQEGFLQGTAEQVKQENWEIYDGVVSRSTELYRRLYGNEFVDSILG